MNESINNTKCRCTYKKKKHLVLCFGRGPTFLKSPPRNISVIGKAKTHKERDYRSFYIYKFGLDKYVSVPSVFLTSKEIQFLHKDWRL